MGDIKFSGHDSGFTKTLHIGLTIAGSIAFFVYVGIWLDRKFITGNVFTLAGFIWAVVGTNVYIYLKFLRKPPEDGK